MYNQEVDISHMLQKRQAVLPAVQWEMYVHSEQKQSTGCAQFCRFTVK